MAAHIVHCPVCGSVRASQSPVDSVCSAACAAKLHTGQARGDVGPDYGQPTHKTTKGKPARGSGGGGGGGKSKPGCDLVLAIPAVVAAFVLVRRTRR